MHMMAMFFVLYIRSFLYFICNLLQNFFVLLESRLKCKNIVLKPQPPTASLKTLVMAYIARCNSSRSCSFYYPYYSHIFLILGTIIIPNNIVFSYIYQSYTFYTSHKFIFLYKNLLFSTIFVKKNHIYQCKKITRKA